MLVTQPNLELDKATGLPHPRTVKRRSLRLMIALVAALSCALVTGTSFAAYRATMGPKQCCKQHCKRDMPDQRAAKQCCRAHPAIPAATDTAPHTAAVAPIALLATVPVATLPPLAAVTVASPEHRGPPGRGLLAQHTSLAL